MLVLVEKSGERLFGVHRGVDRALEVDEATVAWCFGKWHPTGSWLSQTSGVSPFTSGLSGGHRASRELVRQR